MFTSSSVVSKLFFFLFAPFHTGIFILNHSLWLLIVVRPCRKMTSFPPFIFIRAWDRMVFRYRRMNRFNANRTGFFLSEISLSVGMVRRIGRIQIIFVESNQQSPRFNDSTKPIPSSDFYHTFVWISFTFMQSLIVISAMFWLMRNRSIFLDCVRRFTQSLVWHIVNACAASEIWISSKQTKKFFSLRKFGISREDRMAFRKISNKSFTQDLVIGHMKWLTKV